jgi:DNA-binding response OmpR family regulator
MESNKTILVIDDDRQITGLLTAFFETEGYHVVSANDGAEGLTFLASTRPHLILLDMHMPGMDGWGFAREFHAREDHRIPLLLLTAHREAATCAEQVGAQGYISKPFDLDNLLATVRQFV